mmetsp:Transcript_3563/g.5284  ORF Transcript_3563/g.5284 Transcript_3563/m.5284 type:complete len:200 (+) Transcript_3563:391-990(+)
MIQALPLNMEFCPDQLSLLSYPNSYRRHSIPAFQGDAQLNQTLLRLCTHELLHEILMLPDLLGHCSGTCFPAQILRVAPCISRACQQQKVLQFRLASSVRSCLLFYLHVFEIILLDPLHSRLRKSQVLVPLPRMCDRQQDHNHRIRARHLPLITLKEALTPLWIPPLHMELPPGQGQFEHWHPWHDNHSRRGQRQSFQK